MASIAPQSQDQGLSQEFEGKELYSSAGTFAQPRDRDANGLNRY